MEVRFKLDLEGNVDRGWEVVLIFGLSFISIYWFPGRVYVYTQVLPRNVPTFQKFML